MRDFLQTLSLKRKDKMRAADNVEGDTMAAAASGCPPAYRSNQLSCAFHKHVIQGAYNRIYNNKKISEHPVCKSSSLGGIGVELL